MNQYNSDFQQILKKYILKEPNFQNYNLADFYSDLDKIKLSIQEQIVIFYYFFNMSSSGFKILPSLVQNIISNRNNLGDLFYELIFCSFSPNDIFKLTHNLKLNSSEEKNLWDLFGKLYPDYVNRNLARIGEGFNLNSFLNQKIKELGQINILDLGCGRKANGLLDIEKFYFNKVILYGVDIKLDKQIRKNNLLLIEADLRNLPFSNSDIIYSIHVLQYFDLEELIKIFDDVYRILKKGGFFIFNSVSIDIREILLKSNFKGNIFTKNQIPELKTAFMLVKN